MSKCICHLNGYEIKDSRAREQLEITNENLHDTSVYAQGIARELSVLSARVDENIATSEENTEGNTELIDMRIDFEGNTHSTAGESMRSQARGNRDLINKKVDFIDERTDSKIEITHGNGVVNLNVKYPIATNPLLDEIAYENKSYRDIFVTNNIVSVCDFENGIPDIYQGNIHGSPEITSEVKNGGSHSLKCFGETSNHIMGSYTFNEPATLYSGCAVKCNRYVNGKIGVQIVHGKAYEAVFNRTTEGFESASIIFNVTNETNKPLEILHYVGAFSSANIDGYVDDCVLVDLSIFNTQPTKEQMDLIYNEYLKRIKGLSYELDVITEEEKTIIENETKEFTPNECITAFMEKVNEKTSELGMSNSFFDTPSGAGTTNLTTAKDLVKLFISATSYNDLMKVWGKDSKVITTKNVTPKSVTVETTVANPTLENAYYIFGGKTGSWQLSDGVMYNLGVIGEVAGKMVAGVVMKCSSATGRFTAMKELFDIAKQIIENPDIDTSTLSVANAQSCCCCIVPEYNVNCYENYPFNYLFEQNSETVHVPCSVTKVISSMVMLDYVKDVNETIEFISSDLISGSGAVFSAGDIITYKDSLYALMLPSSNMTAQCVARHVGEKILRLG